MKQSVNLLIAVLLSGILISCEKQNEKALDTLNVSGIKSGNPSEIVNVKLKSGSVNSSPIDCYIMASTLFDPKTKGFGYVDCYNHFNLLDPRTGDTIRSFEVPGFLSQTVLDSVDGMLIGQCYENGANYVYKINLETGEVTARNPVDFGPGIFACTYFYREPEKEYVLIRADSVMMSIDPSTGDIVHTVKLATPVDNGYYLAGENLLVGTIYDAGEGMNYLVTLSAATGEVIRSVPVSENHDYYACISGFDPSTGCYILVTPENRILFIDISSGEIRDSYQTDFQIQEFKFWREYSPA